MQPFILIDVPDSDVTLRPDGIHAIRYDRQLRLTYVHLCSGSTVPLQGDRRQELVDLIQDAYRRLDDVEFGFPLGGQQ